MKTEEHIPERNTITTRIQTLLQRPTLLAKTPEVRIEIGSNNPKFLLSAAMPKGACKRQPDTWKIMYKRPHSEYEKPNFRARIGSITGRIFA